MLTASYKIMKIKYSDNGEISLKGSPSELEHLHNDIIGMQRADKHKLIVNIENSYDPAPYDYAANKIVFNVSTKNSIQIEDASLKLKGTRGFFKNFALNLPFDIDEVPYHIHYDYISFPEFLKEGSLGMVIEATS